MMVRLFVPHSIIPKFLIMSVNLEHIEWVADELRHTLKIAPPSLDLSIHVYVTRGPSGSRSSPSQFTVPNREHSSLPASEVTPARIALPRSPSCSNPSSTQPFASSIPKNSEDANPTPPPPTNQIQIHRSRPPIHTLISTTILATPSQHHVSVGACGPLAMTRDVSQAVRREIRPLDVVRGERRRMARLLVEEYGW